MKEKKTAERATSRSERGCIVSAVIVSIIGLSFGIIAVYSILNDPFNPSSPNYYYRDRVEYPLEMVDVNDNSEYVIVKWQHGPTESYEAVADTQLIKDNAVVFSVDNDGTIYGTRGPCRIWFPRGSHWASSQCSMPSKIPSR